MKLPGVRGYILEEILASLIQSTGYRLLVSPSQDQRSLEKNGAGLVVKGRGGNHQVDVLGELDWIPAFTFPIRLFVEAKCHSDALGIQYARGAVGIVSDLNQLLIPGIGTPPMQRFSYHYALFSTSGFAKTTTSFAMAHHVSLIDLSTNDFRPLKDAVYRLAETVMGFTEGENIGGIFLSSLRTKMRLILKTWPEGVDEPRSRQSEEVATFLEGSTFRSDLRNYRNTFSELLVGVASGPFLLVFQTEDMTTFLDYARDRSNHRIQLTWEADDQGGRRWRVSPISGEGPTYELYFALPEMLSQWIFGSSRDVQERAIRAKQEFFSSITIYRRDADGDHHIYRLNYAPRDIRRVR